MLKMLIIHGEHSASLGIRSTRSQIRSAHGKKKKKRLVEVSRESLCAGLG